MRRAALLHDLGNLAVSEALLAFQGPLTTAQHVQVRSHAEVGATMLARAGLHFEARWVRHHHERLDGRGYPDGLQGDAIPLPMRCLSVADVYDALTSDRSYRKALAREEAIRLMREEASVGMWDLRIVDALDGVLTRG